MGREGVLVEPYQRLKLEQVKQIHRASLAILTDPGVVCFNRHAADIFGDHGAEVLSIHQGGAACWLLKIPERIITDAVQAAPKVVKLGARDENNCLILDGREPRVHFASGSEANNWLDVDVETFVSKNEPGFEVDFPVFRVEKGTTDRLAKAARLCEHLDSWDSFLRTVNIQDDDITDDNKDVKKCLMDVRRFIRQFCKPLKIIPRIYLTGGKGFQMNIDFHSPVDLPEHIKRPAIKEYLRHLKDKYKLKTLDDICINNSVSCMRRIVNTAYISQIEGIPTGVWCTQFTVKDIMTLDIASLYALALENTGRIIPPQKSKRAQRMFVEFLCDKYEIRHTGLFICRDRRGLLHRGNNHRFIVGKGRLGGILDMG